MSHVIRLKWVMSCIVQNLLSHVTMKILSHVTCIEWGMNFSESPEYEWVISHALNESCIVLNVLNESCHTWYIQCVEWVILYTLNKLWHTYWTHWIVLNVYVCVCVRVYLRTDTSWLFLPTQDKLRWALFMWKNDKCSWLYVCTDCPPPSHLWPECVYVWHVHMWDMTHPCGS